MAEIPYLGKGLEVRESQLVLSSDEVLRLGSFRVFCPAIRVRDHYTVI